MKRTMVGGRWWRMSRTFAVIRREFTEVLRSRVYIITTILGPVLIAGIFGFQILMFRSTGGEKHIVIVDQTSQHMGLQLAAILRGGDQPSRRATYKSDVVTP